MEGNREGEGERETKGEPTHLKDTNLPYLIRTIILSSAKYPVSLYTYSIHRTLEYS